MTGEASRVYMLKWDTTFIFKLTQLGLDFMYKRYVDDTNPMGKAIKPGVRLVDDQLILLDDKVEDDLAIPADRRTGEILQQIGNSIASNIKLTMDCPSNHPSGWMPLLDIQARVEGGGGRAKTTTSHTQIL